MRRLSRVLCFLIIAAGTCVTYAQPDPGPADVAAPEDPAPRTLPRHSDSVRLTRLTAGILPPDGLLTVGLGTRGWTTAYLVNDGTNDQLHKVGMRDWYVLAEASPWRWLQVNAEVPWRTWNDGIGWIPESGSGLGDGRWQLASGRALAGSWLHGLVHAGGNLPLGSVHKGLGEGVFSPRAGAVLTVRLWERSQLPELRLHLNGSHTWNRREVEGFGMGHSLLEPWPPRYQSAAAAGGVTRNDALTWGAALEFRRRNTSLWLEYARDTFRDNPTVGSGEQLATLGAGLRWGVQEGWALEGGYVVSLTADDESTAWWPAYPDWLMRVAVTRQFSLGGHDGDGDGIVDRRDRCPGEPEDIDGFQDDDGCPDYDNDGDGIADRHDAAPDAAEDFDGFQDGDGVPDPDNDGDGIPDVQDLCPLEPEDLDGHHDDDGCPDVLQDRDGDGVEDDADRCPDTPEDADGFEDADGCPEPDNDMDGIPDGEDDCPDTPEDYDGDRDDDGCPDTDDENQDPD